MLQHGAHTTAGNARQQVVVGRRVRRKHAGWQARCARRRGGGGVQHLHLPAAPRQAGGSGSACQPRSHHGAARRRSWCCQSGAVARCARLPARLVAGAQQAGRRAGLAHRLQCKAALRQQIGIGGAAVQRCQPRAPLAATRQRLGGVRVQVKAQGIGAGCCCGVRTVGLGGVAQSVQKNGVHRPCLLAQLQQRVVAHAERQQHLATVQRNAVQARQQPPQVRVQAVRQRLQRRVGSGSRGQQQGGCANGFALQCHKVQQPRPRRVGPPRRPGGQKAQPVAQASVEHAPLRLPRPRCGQTAARQKGVALQQQGAVCRAARLRGRRHINGHGWHGTALRSDENKKGARRGAHRHQGKSASMAGAARQLRRWAARSPGWRRRRHQRSAAPAGVPGTGGRGRRPGSGGFR